MNSSTRFALAAAAALVPFALHALAPTGAQANVGEAYGFGSRAGALAGSTVSWGFDGNAAYVNPAALGRARSEDDKRRLELSWSLLAMTPSFTPIRNVVIENTYVSDKGTIGEVDTAYRNTQGQALGLSYLILPESRLTAGLGFFLPIDHLAALDTGEAFIPEYVLYRSRTQRPQFHLAAGASLGKGFSAGAGLYLGFSLTSAATVFLQTDASKASTLRFNASMQPRMAPYLGLLYASEGPQAAAGSWSAGLVLRAPIYGSNTMTLKSGARIFNGLPGVDFNFSALGTMYFDPAALEIGGSFQVLDDWRAYAQADFQNWAAFKAPALEIQDPDCLDPSDNCGVDIQGGRNPGFNHRNIWVLRAGQELRLSDSLTLRAGYAFRPGMMSALPTGAGNYLDPDKHMLALGAGLAFRRFLAFETPCTLDLHASYHALVSQRITKSPGDEAGQGTGDQKIGAPGYEAGGKVYGGGLSLSLAF